MLTETLEPQLIPVAREGKTQKKEKYLFHPIIDFLCLGGGSVVLFVILALFAPLEAIGPQVSALALALATFINFPHFIHSYQIFYQNYWQKAFQTIVPIKLRIRYILSGIVVPSALIFFFGTSVLMNDPHLLGFAGNIMLFFVGWHYVKQGYGMIIVDSVLKGRFFSTFEKNTLLVNAYVCWAFFWLLTNWTIAEENFFGLSYAMLTIPTWSMYAGGVLTACSTGMVIYVLANKRIRDGIKLPFNGTVAYFTALYVWLALRLDPFFLALIPVSHSLQYLIVVWRYQLNKTSHSSMAFAATEENSLHHIPPTQYIWKFSGFVVSGIVLGYLSFWTIPQLLDSSIPYNHAVFGETMFLFIFWIFINLHHYFIDNVIWRRENPDTKRFLFGAS